MVKNPLYLIRKFLRIMTTLFMNKGLKFRLGFPFAFISLVPLIVIGYFSYTMFFSTLLDIRSRHLNDIINEINVNMFMSLKDIDNISKVVINTNLVKEILSNKLEKDPEEYSKNNLRMNSLLKSISFSNDYKKVYIFYQKKMIIFLQLEMLQEIMDWYLLP